MPAINESTARFPVPGDSNGRSDAFPVTSAIDREKEVVRKQWLKRLKRDIGSRYAGCRLWNFEISGAESERDQQSRAIAKLKSYEARMRSRVASGENIIFLGGVGTGKDHLVSALALAAIAVHGLEVRWSDGCRLFSLMRDNISLDRSEESLLAPLERADVLYLSDPVPPDCELTQYQKAAIFRLIDTRYRNLKPTWMTCNFQDGGEAAKFLSESIVDRLRDAATIISADWDSRRKPRNGRVGSGGK